MQQYTDEQILEKYNNLPQDLKNAIFGVEMTETIKKIGEKYQLSIDKIGLLGNETGMVMIGLTHPNNFISNLSQRLNIDKETTRKIGEEINNQIFAKIRESLKKVHGASPAPEAAPAKEEILKEIEKEEVPEIIKGVTNPFETKTKEIVRMPPVEKKYSGEDPYREPIE